jgi:uncharacterized protein YegL
MANIYISLSETSVDNTKLLTIRNDTTGLNKKRLCLLIDNSGSMSGERLDLVIHATKMLISTSDETIEIAIFTFSSTCEQLTEFTIMTFENKTVFLDIVSKIVISGSTNLIDGLKKSLKYIYSQEMLTETHLLVFTDGEPDDKNLSHYQQIIGGIKNCSIDVFGFGNSLSKNILEYIYTTGNGVFGFISDKNMLATIFVNYMANFRATNISDVDLSYIIIYGHDIQEIKTLNIGSMQSGQEKNFIINMDEDSTFGNASISFKKKCVLSFDHIEIDNEKYILEKHIYHTFRTALIKSIKDRNESEMHLLYQKYFDMLIGIQECSYKNDIKILLEDILSTDPNKGQLMKALQNKSWGEYYLMTIEQAHENQEITNFKDESLMKYGSSLARSFTGDLDAMFNDIPYVNSVSYSSHGQQINQNASQYNDRSAGCFAGICNVSVYGGTKQLCELQVGDILSKTNYSQTVVSHILVSLCPRDIYRNGSLYGTGNHPIMNNNGEWIFFKDMNGSELFNNHDFTNIYSIGAQEIFDNGNAFRHVDNIIIENVICATIGHGYLDNNLPISPISPISSTFWGYNIINIINEISGNHVLIMYVNDYFIRDVKTGFCIGLEFQGRKYFY